MPSNPHELEHKCQHLSQTWQAYGGEPSFEHFVEFTVTLNSFAEYLLSHGLTGLHHLSQELEQQALGLFGDEALHPIAAPAMATLNERVTTLVERVIDYGCSSSRAIDERRIDSSAMTATDLSPGRELWLISEQPTPWQPLLAQLGYFGIHTQVHNWSALETITQPVPTLLLDLGSNIPADWRQRVQRLRQQFSGCNLLGLAVESDFSTLQSTLSAGCDLCLPRGMSQATIVGKILERYDSGDDDGYRVLIVEDSNTAVTLIRRTLAEHDIDSQAINDPRHVLSALERYQPDLILMDMHMPDCTGVEAARVIRQHPQFLSTPIVYLSSETDVGMQIEALRLGGDHFLTKPFNPVWLAAIVKSKIERYRELRNSMLRDSLTGLLNHTSSKRALDLALGQAAIEHAQLAVAMIDIDHFKQINDRYGHPIGDQVIRSLSWLLKQRLRKGDIVGRYGGEEFLVGLVDTGVRRAYEVIDRIRRDFAEIHHPFNETWFSTSFSAGISCYPAVGSAEALIKQADNALYQAKHAGRNQVLTALM